MNTRMSMFWRTLTLAVVVALLGAIGTVAVGAALGMPASDLSHLPLLLLPAAIVTVAAAVAAPRLLMGTSVRWQLAAVAITAAGVALANLAILTLRMSVNTHDATLVATLLVYSLGAGLAVALTVARSVGNSVERLERTARTMGDGDLDVRVGDLHAGAELDMLGHTLDEMADRLQEAQARERQVESMRRDLITTVSHDLRTPLASLRAMVEAIDDGIVDDPPSMRRYAGEMRRSVQQVSTMVDDLFELTQLDAGAIEQETRRARLDEVVSSALATVRHQADEKHLSMETDLGGTGALACSPRMVRVLQNLLSNAVRHTPADGTVRVHAHLEGERLGVSVEDSGEGISADDLERIFEPFYRGDPARSGPGAGLGLTLAKRIVEALGGQIVAESSPAHGTRFEIHLPA